MISVTPPEPDRRRQVDVGRHQHGDGAQPGQRGDRDQRAGPGLHQHADPVALAHPDLDQAAHDVVDAAVDRLVGVHAAVEQQEFALGRVVRLLVDDAAQRDSGVVVDLAEPGQPRQRAGRLDGQRAHRLVGGDHRVGRAASQCQRQPRTPRPRRARCRELNATPLSVGSAGCPAIRPMLARLVAVAGDPAHPVGDGRPGLPWPPWIPRPGRNGRRGSDIRRLRRSGAARRMPRTDAGWPMSSTSPTKARTGQVMSVSVTSWPLMAKPPVIIRLCAMNCLSSSEIAGPDQAIQPSRSRNRRCCSRGSSASRSCSWRTKSMRALAVLSGSSI